MAVTLKLSLADAECIGPTLPGGKSLDSLRSFPARQGLGVAWTGVEHHPPEPPGLEAVATLLSKDVEVAQGEVAVDALVDAAKLVGTLPGSRSTASRLRPRRAGRLCNGVGLCGNGSRRRRGRDAGPRSMRSRPLEGLQASGCSRRSGRRACARWNRCAPNRAGRAGDNPRRSSSSDARRRSSPG